MAFQKKLAFEALMASEKITVGDLPDWLKAAVRLFRTDLATAGTLTPELQKRATDLASEIYEWHDTEEDEPDPTPTPAPEPAPAPTPAKLTHAQILANLFAEGRTKLKLADLQAAGFTSSPGSVGGYYGDYELSKAMFTSTYTLTKRR